MTKEIKRVGVVGCGLMGSGIVEVIARSGLDAVVVERDETSLRDGLGRLERSTTKGIQRGKLTEDGRAALLKRVDGHTELDALTGCDVVIEAASEDIAVKIGIFDRLDTILPDSIVMCTNTSSIPIAELAAVTDRPDRVVGTHFFNPPPVMALLEIVRGLETSDDTVAIARQLGEQLGKRVVLSKDRAGFIVNWLLMPYLNSAVRMLEENFASREDIDQAVVLGLAHPMGPLQLLDLIGLDTALAISEVLYDEFKDPLYAPPPLLKRMVTAGYLGRKTRHGFYEYP